MNFSYGSDLGDWVKMKASCPECKAKSMQVSLGSLLCELHNIPRV